MNKPTNDKQFRSILIDTPTDANGDITLSISSDVPYLRAFGYEVLDHTPDALDLTRLNNAAAMLVDHGGDQVGVVDKAWMDSGKAYATVRLSKSTRGAEIEQDIRDGIRRNVSIGYQVLEWANNPDEVLDELPVYHAVKWFIYEVSTVAVPADITVGMGRNISTEQAAVLQSIIDNVPAIQSLLEAHTVNHGTDDEDEPEDVAEDVTTDTTDDTAEDDADEAVIEDISDESKSDTLVMESPDEDEAQDGADKTADLTTAAHRSPAFSLENTPMKTNEDTVVNANITLTEKEQRKYSLSRAITDAADGVKSSFELDISQEISRKLGLKDQGGFWMPTSLQARNFAVGDSTTGGALTETQVGPEFIDYLRNKAQVIKLGAEALSLPGKVALPRLQSDLAASWIAEDGTGATIGSASFAQVTFSPKKLASYTGYTRETLTIANFDIESIVRNNIYAAFAVAFDKAAIQGTGANNQPTGILNMAGLASSSLFTSGSAITYAGAVDCWSIVAKANADNNRLAYLTVPAVAAQAATTIRAGSSLQFIMLDDKTIYGYPVAVSNNVPAYASGGQYMIFGDWSQLALAEFGAINLVVDPYTSKHKGIIEVAATMLADIEVKQPTAFSILKGINA
jgi:HK97 family phage major capsid protein